MRVALTQRKMQSPSGLELGDGLSQAWYEWMRKRIPQALALPVPSDESMLRPWWKVVDPEALILTGGESFGENQQRDAIELSLLTEWAGRIPILGVCRGAQVMNLWAGGTVEADFSGAHAGNNHPILWVNEAVQDLDTFMPQEVNSFHTQVIPNSGLGHSFAPLAQHQDGSIELFANFDQRMLGVVWHPERNSPAGEAFDDWVASLILRWTQK